ncbi:MBG domain-containing protein [Paenibacillus soyae]|uniref:MBG domain-containing protein n=1 Tax=Paenibacillus soyae TaxID=2969249 RepID=UPI0035302CA1
MDSGRTESGEARPDDRRRLISLRRGLSDEGSYAVHASGYASPKYEIAYMPGTLTVTKAPLTVQGIPLRVNTA